MEDMTYTQEHSHPWLLFARRGGTWWWLAVVLCLHAAAQSVATHADKSSATASRDERVANLVSQMTLEEKVSQMQNHAAAIPRLGIPAYDYWSEGLHGSARSGYSTLFPQAIGMAATWDAPLLQQVATVISTEARAKYNHAIAEGNHGIYYGLTIWSPNINIFRDPRWGRGQETYGEDPFLTASLGVAFVSGLQGDDAKYIRAISTPKHFAVHSGPETLRHRFNVDVSPHDLEDTYLPAFRATVTQAHAQSIMCAYNAVDGAPACANPQLLSKILRGEWGFDGFVTSDCGAIGDIAKGHQFTADVEHAAVAAVRAGTDTSCGTEFSTLTQAVKDGLIQEKQLDVAVQRLFRARFELGMFDPPADVAYANLPFSEVDSEPHRLLALQTAREAMVLLKNQDHILPLDVRGKTIGVIGPNAANLAALEGNYNAVPSHPVTPLDGLRNAVGRDGKVLYAQGSGYVDGVMVPVPESVLRVAHGSAEAGLRAEYFANTDFSGTPAVTRTDHQIDFDWNGASPAPGVDAQRFGVRWTGTIAVPVAGDYNFSATLADCSSCDEAESYKVYLDGTMVAQQVTPQRPWRSTTPAPFKLHFADTQPHDLIVEYTHQAPVFGAGITLNWQPPAAALREQAAEVARQSDVVVAFVGLSPHLEGEEMPIKLEGFAGGDRTDIQLPAEQQQMLEAVAATGKPLVVVLMNGSALAVDWAQQHAGAILEAWYPGEEGGTAIAETLLGQNNPAGRLPVTFYASISQLPPFDDYSMHDRTYRYSRALPLYHFGSGLSYTQFRYTARDLPTTKITAGDPLEVSANVSNTGKVAGDEVVEVYLTPPASELVPLRSLVAFKRIHLLAGQSQAVSFRIDPRQLSEVDARGRRSVLPGRYKLYIGGGQPADDAPGLAFEIAGTKPLPE
jgi:beta-glucosidase